MVFYGPTEINPVPNFPGFLGPCLRPSLCIFVFFYVVYRVFCAEPAGMLPFLPSGEVRA